MKQAHVFISGFVQRVGFRQFVKRHALELGIKGWVKNIPDGRVEAVFWGSKQNIDAMILLCKKGPFLTQVEHIEVKWEESEKQFVDFVIS